MLLARTRATDRQCAVGQHAARPAACTRSGSRGEMARDRRSACHLLPAVSRWGRTRGARRRRARRCAASDEQLGRVPPLGFQLRLEEGTLAEIQHVPDVRDGDEVPPMPWLPTERGLLCQPVTIGFRLAHEAAPDARSLHLDGPSLQDDDVDLQASERACRIATRSRPVRRLRRSSKRSRGRPGNGYGPDRTHQRIDVTT